MAMFIQTLSQAFAKFSGKTLLNPNRMTCDVDPVAEEIREEAEQYGLSVHFDFPGKANAPEACEYRLRVGVKNDGGVFKVDSFKIG